jgi:hypothetical protein
MQVLSNLPKPVGFAAKSMVYLHQDPFQITEPI